MTNVNKNSTSIKVTPHQSWRDTIKVHPAAALFPRMSDTELAELADDIKRYGLREKVKVLEHWPCGDNGVSRFEQTVIDGQNRLDAMELAGLPVLHTGRAGTKLDPDLIDVMRDGLETKDDIVAYVISINVRRRHLTGEQKRSLVAELLKTNPDRSNLQTAKIVGVDDKTVASVRRDMEGRSEIPNVTKVTDTRGRKQATRKSAPAKPAKRAEPKEVTPPIEPPSPPPTPVVDEERVNSIVVQMAITGLLDAISKVTPETVAADACAPAPPAVACTPEEIGEVLDEVSIIRDWLDRFAVLLKQPSPIDEVDDKRAIRKNPVETVKPPADNQDAKARAESQKRAAELMREKRACVDRMKREVSRGASAR